ncbi:MAG: Gfo/Idh/MocA family oxidoreductase [Ruminococcaceae bacterium]|nr:Gfo/Idh/MocA family oxidoreductase [Oscillospiraceae bacterium]
MKTVKIGFVGCGAISGIYLKNITNRFKDIEIIGVCDLIRERAEKAVAEYRIPKLYNDMHELFADPEVDIVLNITRPYEHYDVTMAALRAGKNVYSEKPLAASLKEGREIRALAAEKGLMLGGAPDTFLGAGIQTCRKLIDDGVIGDVVGAAGFMICRGHESWHPDPEFYYKYGGGPMFDMGPYYLTALVNLCGCVESVSAMTNISFPKRTITSKPHCGEVIDVDVPTYYAGTMRFASGAIGTLFTTFDVFYPGQARLEVYGSEGTLMVPDPNTFGGPVKLYKPTDGGMQEIPLTFDYPENSRALGLADMAKALQTGRPWRANSDMTFHVLEIMEGFAESGRTHREVAIESRFDKTPLMNPDMPHGVLDV